MPETPKTCILCKHWNFDCGTAMYSSGTPGESWSSGCYMGHFELSGYKVSEQEYRKNLLRADTCPDFEMRTPDAP